MAPQPWARARDLIVNAPDRLTVTLAGNHLFFLGEAGARRTAEALTTAGLLQCWNPKALRKGHAFQQPLAPHEHWHVDISYLEHPSLKSVHAMS
jgi:hypothetical protein